MLIPTTSLELSISSIFMSLDSGRKPEHPVKTQSRTCQSLTGTPQPTSNIEQDWPKCAQGSDVHADPSSILPDVHAGRIEL